MPVGAVLRLLAREYGDLFWGRGFPVLLLILALTAMMIKRTRNLEYQMIGCHRRGLIPDVMLSLLLGLGGGYLASLIFIFLGISIDLNAQTVAALWAVVFLLLLFEMRFVCFSYAGSIVALSHLLFGWPNANVAGMMALVAVLHGVEALLMVASGGRDAVPVFLRRGDQIVGGFVLQKIWPVATVILMGHSGLVSGAVPTPSWWPLIGSNLAVEPGQTITYVMLPLMVILGYSDMTVTMEPAPKARRTGSLLALYSVVLLTLAFQAAGTRAFAFLAAIFGAVGHELVIYLSNRLERERRPRFVSTPDGLQILDILPDSPACSIGLQRGDVIVAINDQPIRQRSDLEEALAGMPFSIHFSVQRNGLSLDFEHHGQISRLGVVPAPGPDERMFVQMKGGGLLRILSAMRERRRMTA